MPPGPTEIKAAERLLKLSQDLVKSEKERLKLQGEFLSSYDKEVLAVESQRQESEKLLGILKNISDISENQKLQTEEKRKKVQQVLDARGDELELLRDIGEISTETFNEQVDALTEIAEAYEKGSASVEQVEKSLKKVNAELTISEKKGKANQQAYSSIKSTTDSIADNVGGLIGLTNQWTKSGVGGMAKMVMEGKNLGMVAKAAGGSFLSLLHPINLAGSLLTGLVEQIKEMLTLTSDLSRTTGAQMGFVAESIDGARASMNDFAGAALFTRAEAGEAFAALHAGMPAFTYQTEAAQNELMVMTGLMQKMGVDGSSAIQASTTAMNIFGLSAVDATAMVYAMAESASEMGINQGAFTDELAKTMPKLMAFGRRGTQMFMNLTKRAKELNASSTEAFFEMAEGFESMDQAAEKTAKLNTLLRTFGGTAGETFHTYRMGMAALDPEMFFNQMVDDLKRAGFSFNQWSDGTIHSIAAMKAFQKEAGFSEDAMQRLIVAIDGVSSPLVKATGHQGTFVDKIKNSTTPMESLAAIFEEIMPYVIVLTEEIVGLTKTVSKFALENGSLIKSLAKAVMWLPAVAAALGIASTAAQISASTAGSLALALKAVNLSAGLVMGGAFAALAGFFMFTAEGASVTEQAIGGLMFILGAAIIVWKMFQYSAMAGWAAATGVGIALVAGIAMAMTADIAATNEQLDKQTDKLGDQADLQARIAKLKADMGTMETGQGAGAGGGPSPAFKQAYTPGEGIEHIPAYNQGAFKSVSKLFIAGDGGAGAKPELVATGGSPTNVITNRNTERFTESVKTMIEMRGATASAPVDTKKLATEVANGIAKVVGPLLEEANTLSKEIRNKVNQPPEVFLDSKRVTDPIQARIARNMRPAHQPM